MCVSIIDVYIYIGICIYISELKVTDLNPCTSLLYVLFRVFLSLCFICLFSSICTSHFINMHVSFHMYIGIISQTRRSLFVHYVSFCALCLFWRIRRGRSIFFSRDFFSYIQICVFPTIHRSVLYMSFLHICLFWLHIGLFSYTRSLCTYQSGRTDYT